MNKRKLLKNWVIIVALIFACIVSSATAAPLTNILFEDSFTVDGIERNYGDPLNGAGTEVGNAKWLAPSSVQLASVEGKDVAKRISTLYNRYTAAIDWDLSKITGNIRAEADVMTLGDNDATRWFAMALQNAAGSKDVLASSSRILVIFRGDGRWQAFENGTSKMIDSDETPVSGYTPGDIVTMGMTYDTATQVVTIDIKGVEIVNYTLATPADIKTFGLCPYDTGQYCDNVTISTDTALPIEYMPEPADNTDMERLLSIAKKCFA